MSLERSLFARLIPDAHLMEKNQFNVKKIFQTNTDKKVKNIVVDTEVEATIQQKMIRFYVYGHFTTLALVEMPGQFCNLL